MNNPDRREAGDDELGLGTYLFLCIVVAVIWYAVYGFIWILRRLPDWGVDAWKWVVGA